MEYIFRIVQHAVSAALERGKSILLLGARQTGKSTLINQLQTDLLITLIKPIVRRRYEQNPSILTGEIEALAESKGIKPLVVIDEIQKVPEILDVVQDLIDRQIAQFILTGSSARKLRLGAKVNLLPGRVVVLRLDPLTIAELIPEKLVLEELLLYGTLPGILMVSENEDKEIDLASYVITYLEEEVRMEALVRNIGNFSRFLNLAASESGNTLNFRKLSQEIGVSHTTISSYYQILEDCLIVEKIDPYLKTKTRRKLAQTSKYLFFDLGVRRLSAEEGIKLPQAYFGRLFEQWVGLELIRASHFSQPSFKLYYWRDLNGAEIDWVIVKEQRLIPIEVKWTDSPNISDLKHIKLFKTEYENVEIAYIVCRVPRRVKLAEGVYALPWQQLHQVILAV